MSLPRGPRAVLAGEVGVLSTTGQSSHATQVPISLQLALLQLLGSRHWDSIRLMIFWLNVKLPAGTFFFLFPFAFALSRFYHTFSLSDLVMSHSEARTAAKFDILGLCVHTVIEIVGSTLASSSTCSKK